MRPTVVQATRATDVLSQMYQHASIVDRLRRRDMSTLPVGLPIQRDGAPGTLKEPCLDDDLYWMRSPRA